MNKHDLKRKISEAAAMRAAVNRFFSISSLAAKAGVKESEIDELFKTRNEILEYYYESRISAYREQREMIDDYSQFTLSEKLSNLFLMLIELLSEDKQFVEKTYSQLVVNKTFCRSGFRHELIAELNQIFSDDEKVSTTCRPFLNKYSYNFIFTQFHGLVWFWLSDKSPHQENTLALIDKWSALIEEICYSKITDKSFDLLKFLAYNSPLKNLPSQRFKNTRSTL
ncbi:MAG: hypothetical protein EA391_05040 [Balneolaceae bacterium]|nr:MAG: hypothetical protein EA391_05040 [Balneolaceae bacterium]